MNKISYLVLLSFLMVVFLFPNEVNAGCNINIYVKNGGNNKIRVMNSMLYSSVRNKTGTWRALFKGGWFHNAGTIDVNPGETKGDGYIADFSCSAERRYKIDYQCYEGSYKGSFFTTYYPSADGYTTDQNVTINLKNCQ
jgi:hypothetical protein